MTVCLFNVLGFLAALAWSFFSSGSETAFYRTSRVRMRVRGSDGDGAAGLVSDMLDGLESMVTTLLISNNVANYLGTYFFTMQLMALRVPQYEILATVILTPIYFVFGESLPKQLAYNHADRWALATVRPLSLMRRVLKPAIWALTVISLGLRRLLRVKGEGRFAEGRRAGLLEYFEAGVAENILTVDQTHMARRVIELEGLTASSVMVPLSRIPILPERATRLKAAADLARKRAAFALLADVSGRTTDRVITIDVLIQEPGESSDPVQRVAPRLGRVSSGASLSEILRRLRQEHAQRIAVEERGRIVGVITTHSILDRIAGTGQRD